ncbi:MAG: hypothetical protein [Arizlama microvirus]|nr:MAG: hypothetical protein [Arizlama microvirus]
MAKKSGRRGASVTAIRLRRYLRDESGRMPAKHFKSPSLSLPDWFFEPVAFQARVKRREIEKTRSRLTKAALGLALLQADDGRRFHPSKPLHRPLRNLQGHQGHRLLVGNPTSRKSRGKRPSARSMPSAAVPYGVRFDQPQQLLLCIRRKRRKEVIHAIGRAGTKVRPPRRNEYSGVSC